MNSHFSLYIQKGLLYKATACTPQSNVLRYCSVISVRSTLFMACIASTVAYECVWHTIHLFLLDRVLTSFVANERSCLFYSLVFPFSRCISCSFIIIVVVVQFYSLLLFFFSYYFFFLLKWNLSNINSVCSMLLSINCQWCRIRCVV